MRPLRLCFLWHMHQPLYTDPTTHRPLFPWVAAHALKNYFDMPYRAQAHGLKVTFNLTSTLITQLMELSSLIDTLSGEWLLAHCGNYLRHHHPLIHRLARSEHPISAEETTALRQALRSFVRLIVPYYKKLAKEKKIGLTTTPFYHPILPLLIDPSHALRPNPHALMPQRHTPFVQEAHIQIQRAQELFERVFGYAVEGFWPAEGSLSPESVQMLHEHGIRWSVSDESLLSEGNHPYRCYQHSGVRLFFRDRDLSDSIGFRYAKLDAHAAVDDFLRKLNAIYDLHEDPIVTVALDGENAWEYYPNNGEDFFKTLYTRLKETPWIDVCLFDEIDTPPTPLEHMRTGSWAGDFSIWIGSEPKNHLWERLSRAKEAMQNRHLPYATYQKAQETLMVALSSDWFWWEGSQLDAITQGLYRTLFDGYETRLIEWLELDPLPCGGSTTHPPTGMIALHEWIGEGYRLRDLRHENVVMPLEHLYAEYIAYHFGENVEIILIGRRLHTCDTLHITTPDQHYTLSLEPSLFFGMLRVQLHPCERFELALYQGEHLRQAIPLSGAISRGDT